MTDTEGRGVIADVFENLAGIFRHMLPGVLVVGAAKLAHPNWFARVDFMSWQHLTVLAVITVAVGNTWFALNRYGLHQAVDYLLYFRGWGKPAKAPGSGGYFDELGKYVYKSRHVPQTSARAQQLVAFRSSTVLLILTLGELSIVFGWWHSANSPFEGHGLLMIVAGLAVFAIGLWQMVITRFIDNYIVNPPTEKPEPAGYDEDSNDEPEND
jgi:hypothetical protein